VRGAEHISETGRARLRQALSMAALRAARHAPAFRAFSGRRLARGKPKPVALVAVARKPLALKVTLVRHKRAYAPLAGPQATALTTRR
jgi:transposase